jgi:hypothetical protein
MITAAYWLLLFTFAGVCPIVAVAAAFHLSHDTDPTTSRER